MAEQAFFTRQMQLKSRGEGRYAVAVDPAWNCPVVPHGGLASSLAAKAMLTELDQPEQRLRSITTVFAAPVQAGPVEIDVRVLRRGRSISQVAASMRSVGQKVGLESMAVFGAERPGFSFVDLTPPVVAPPEECPSFRDPPPDGIVAPFRFPFWEHVEGRSALGHAPWEDFVPTTSDRAAWYRFDEVPVDDAGVLDPLALVTLCDTMPGAVREKIGNDAGNWMPPSADLTVHLFGETQSEWVLAVNHARQAGDGYASLDIELWDPAGPLLAYGTQVMFFTFSD
jgi:acyl-CoA thioesterase